MAGNRESESESESESLKERGAAKNLRLGLVFGMVRIIGYIYIYS